MHKIRIALIFSLVMICAPLASARAEFRVEQYPYYQDLIVSNPDTYYIELNAAILKASRDDLADIRLVDHQAQEIPYFLETYAEQANTVTAAKITRNLNLDSDRRLIVLDSRNDHLSHNGIVLEIESAEDFACDVLIEGSWDNEQYDSLAMNRIYGRGGQIYQNELTYPLKNYRYIRLNIRGENASSLMLEKAEYVYHPLEDQSLALLSAMLVNDFHEPSNNSSNYIIDLGVKNLTIHDVLIQCPQTGFTRLVNVFDSNDGETWKLITQEARIFDYRWTEFSGRDDSVEVDRNTGRYLKIEILNEGESELDVLGINVLGMVPRLVAPLNSGTYRLYYGDPDGVAPSYQNKLAEGSESNKIHPVLDANRQQDNPSFSPPTGYVSEGFNNLIINIILLVCFLAVAAILSRNILKAIKRKHQKAIQ